MVKLKFPSFDLSKDHLPVLPLSHFKRNLQMGILGFWPKGTGAKKVAMAIDLQMSFVSFLSKV